MEVVNSLTSVLIIAVLIALVILSFWFDMRRRSRRNRGHDFQFSPHEWQASAASTDVAPPLAPTLKLAPTHALDEFICQYTPADQDLYIYARHAMFGPSTHPITVHNGGHLMLFGPCAASVTVRPGGTATVYGLVTGDLVNEGGDLHVYGTVIGRIQKNGGATRIHPVARVTSQNE